MDVIGIAPANFLGEIRLGDGCPCGQDYDGEANGSDRISPDAEVFRCSG
jgi:hypothetical protein